MAAITLIAGRQLDILAAPTCNTVGLSHDPATWVPKQDILDAGSDEQARELVETRLRKAGFNLSRHIDCKFDRVNEVYIYEQRQFLAYEHAGIVVVRSEILGGEFIRIGRVQKRR